MSYYNRFGDTAESKWIEMVNTGYIFVKIHPREQGGKTSYRWCNKQRFADFKRDEHQRSYNWSFVGAYSKIYDPYIIDDILSDNKPIENFAAVYLG
jgi:hypothetical protein